MISGVGGVNAATIAPTTAPAPKPPAMRTPTAGFFLFRLSATVFDPFFDGNPPMEIDCFIAPSRGFGSPSRGFGRPPSPRPPRAGRVLAAVLIGGPLIMMALIILGIAAGEMVAAWFY